MGAINILVDGRSTKAGARNLAVYRPVERLLNATHGHMKLTRHLSIPYVISAAYERAISVQLAANTVPLLRPAAQAPALASPHSLLKP